MGRLKTFRKYILWIIGFYIFTIVLTYIGLNATYKNINYLENLPAGITINLAQSTKVNGRILGEITTSRENDLEGKFIKVDIYTKNKELLGSKYLKIKNTYFNEPKKFAVYYTAENIKYYTIEILDDTEENTQKYESAKNLYKDIFQDEELKAITIISLILGLVYVI